MKSRYNTLTVQLLICFAVLLLSVSFFTQTSKSHINSEKAIGRSIDALNEPFAQLYAGFDTLSGMIFTLGFEISGDFDSVEYYAVTDMLLDTAAELRNTLCYEAYYREVVDLYHMLETYGTTCNRAIVSLAARDYEDVVAATTHARLLERFIRESLAAVGNEISARNRQYLRNADASRVRYYWIAVIVTGVVFGICFFIAVFIRRKVIRPILRIVGEVEDFRLTDDLDTFQKREMPPQKRNLNEVIALDKAVREMQEKVLLQHSMEMHNELLRGQLTEEKLHTLQVEKQLQEARLKALQAQINPHFLFNTLNMISQMSYLEEAQHTTELLETFSEFFRYNVEKFDKAVTLEDEINNVRGYVQLQKERFGSRIDYEISIDTELLDVCVPCLTIQPLVENAISHGLRFRTEGGWVRVAVSKKEQVFEIAVSDNGCGMGAEDVAELHKRICKTEGKTDENEHSSIGMSNVYQRMRLRFGEKLRFEIESAPMNGTKVVLSVFGEEAE